MSLHDDLLKHQILVQRLIGTEVKSIQLFLDALKRRAASVVNLGFSFAAVKMTLRGVMTNLPPVSMQNMQDIAIYESVFTSKLYSKYSNAKIKQLTSAEITAVLKNNNMSINFLTGGKKAPKKSLETAYKQYAQRKADDITQIIRDYTSLGRTAEETVNAINERVDGLLLTQAKALAQTAINFSVAITRTETLKNNYGRVLWVADLEVNEHCSECEGLDGNVYNVDDIDEPPLHWGCACHLEPLIDEGE